MEIDTSGAEGDYVAIVEENKNAIAQYIKNQLERVLQRLKFPSKSIWSGLRAARIGKRKKGRLSDDL
jgi:hypothetical protein